MQRLTKIALLVCSLLLAACSEPTKEIHLLTGADAAELARTHLAKAVLEQQGFTVTVSEVRLGQIWQRLWAGKADASVTVWLPQASAPFVERFFDRLDDMGPKSHQLAGETWPSQDKPHTIIRRSLEQEAPKARAILRDLQWQPQDLEQIMAHWQQSQNWNLAAQSWLAEHQHIGER
ncbi:MAG: glycine betaine ABC transporter substrate-binding protein [Oceanisphaera sp.]|uniref:glycine betaine ABC transporter substrate-binding protein n=1 Tax=Oceanisphaera sp. TaxID=1929979 RepID=UPI003F953CCF